MASSLSFSNLWALKKPEFSLTVIHLSQMEVRISSGTPRSVEGAAKLCFVRILHCWLLGPAGLHFCIHRSDSSEVTVQLYRPLALELGFHFKQ